MEESLISEIISPRSPGEFPRRKSRTNSLMHSWILPEFFTQAFLDVFLEEFLDELPKEFCDKIL